MHLISVCPPTPQLHQSSSFMGRCLSWSYISRYTVVWWCAEGMEDDLIPKETWKGLFDRRHWSPGAWMNTVIVWLPVWMVGLCVCVCVCVCVCGVELLQNKATMGEQGLVVTLSTFIWISQEPHPFNRSPPPPPFMCNGSLKCQVEMEWPYSPQTSSIQNDDDCLIRLVRRRCHTLRGLDVPLSFAIGGERNYKMERVFKNGFETFRFIWSDLDLTRLLQVENIKRKIIPLFNLNTTELSGYAYKD